MINAPSLSPTSNIRVDLEPGRSRSPYFYENPLRVNDDSLGYFTLFSPLKGFLCAQRWLPFAGQCDGHRAPGRFPIFYPSFFAVGEVPKWVLREAVAAPSENELHVVPKYRPSSPPPAFSGRLLDADEITSASWLRRPRGPSSRDTATASSDWRRLRQSRCPVCRLYVAGPPSPTNVCRNA